MWIAGCVDEKHVRFGDAARGNRPVETPAPRPRPTPTTVNIRLEEHRLCLLGQEANLRFFLDGWSANGTSLPVMSGSRVERPQPRSGEDDDLDA